MLELDDKGRIKKFSFRAVSGPPYSGHSVCNICGKDMPVCWDVVCYKCSRTFCYECAKVKKGHWFCKECG
jgi:hypothetical protein